MFQLLLKFKPLALAITKFPHPFAIQVYACLAVNPIPLLTNYISEVSVYNIDCNID